MLWIIPIATGVYFVIKWHELGVEFGAIFFMMGAVCFIFSALYTIYFCCMPKVILSINSNDELILPHKKVIPLNDVQKLNVKVYGRQMIEIFPPSGLLIIKTASETYRYYFIKNPDDVQEKTTEILYKYKYHIPQDSNFDLII